jgi:cob(I)alamin adenosyltransferase
MGYVYLYTGTGGGKTTNALGLALRSVGHKHKVVIIQFLKYWKSTGEYKIKDKLKPYYEIYQFGRPGWFKLDGSPKVYKFGNKKFVVKNLGDADKLFARKGLEFAKKVLREKKPDLLILDEINLALHWKLLNVKDVIKLLDKVPKKTEVVLTGRFAPKELIKRADFVNIIKDLKYPKKIPATKGIQY